MAKEKKEEPTESKDRIGQVLKVGDWVVHPDWGDPYQVASFTPTGNPRCVFHYSRYHQKDILKPFRRDKVIKVSNTEGGESSREELQTLVDAYQETNEKLTLQVIELEKKLKELQEKPTGPVSEESSAYRVDVERYLKDHSIKDLQNPYPKGTTFKWSTSKEAKRVPVSEGTYWDIENNCWVVEQKEKEPTDGYS